MIRTIAFSLLAVFLFSCAEEPEEKVVEIGRDEEGFPIACDIMADSFVVNLFSQATSLGKNGTKLDNGRQSCHIFLNDTNENEIGEIRVIIRQKEPAITIRGQAKSARNAEFIDDLEFPAMWKSVSGLHMFTFNYGAYNITLNMSVRRIPVDQLLPNAKQLAIHIAANLKANGFEEGNPG